MLSDCSQLWHTVGKLLEGAGQCATAVRNGSLQSNAMKEL